MRKLLLPLLLVLLPPLAAQEMQKENAPHVERYRLDNGLTVLIERRAQLPLVNVTCFYRVGAANEVPGITGVAHYVEHMVFRGTENVSPADITGTFERIGGRWNAYTELDQTLYAETVPSWALDSALRMEAERMSRALFDPAEFNRERGSVIAEINSYVGDPAERLGDLVRMTSFEIHPYRSNTLGYDVPVVTRDEAYRFYKDYYGPNNAVLVIVGDVDSAAARALVAKYFDGLVPAPRTHDVRVVEPPQRGEKRVVLVYPGAQQHVAWVFRAPAATHPDFPTLLVLDALLSGAPHPLPLGDGEAQATSRLEQAVDAAGGSGAGATLQFSRYANLYSLRAKADPGADLAKIETALQAELDRIANNGVPAEELAAARRRMSAADAMAGGTLAEVAHRLAFFQALGSWALSSEIQQAAMRVTSSDVQAFVRAWLKPEQRTVGIHRIGPAAPDTTAVSSAPRPAPAPFVKPTPVPPQALQPLAAPKISYAWKLLPNGVLAGAAQRAGNFATIFVRLRSANQAGVRKQPLLELLAARTLTADAALRAGLASNDATIASTADDTPNDFSAATQLDIEVRCPAESLSAMLPLLGHALARSEFTAREIERSRKDFLSELEALGDDARRTARESAVRLALPDWTPSLIAPETAKQLSVEAVKDYLDEFLTGHDVIVAVAAPLEPSAMLHAAEDAFGGIRKTRPEKVEVSSGPVVERLIVEKLNNDSEIRIAMPGKTRVEIAAASFPALDSPADELPLKLLNYIVGETGYAGRLGRALVEPGLAYEVDSTQRKLGGNTLLEITTATAPADLSATLSSIRRELKALSENGVEDWELQEAKAYALGRMVFALDQNLARAMVESSIWNEVLLDFPARSRAILAVTREDLNRVARRYYDPARFHFGLAGALPPQ